MKNLKYILGGLGVVIVATASLLAYKASLESKIDQQARAHVAELERDAAQAGIPFHVKWDDVAVGLSGASFNNIVLGSSEVTADKLIVSDYETDKDAPLPLELGVKLAGFKIKLTSDDASFLGVPQDSPLVTGIDGNLTLDYKYNVEDRLLSIRDFSLEFLKFGRLSVSGTAPVPTQDELGRIIALGVEAINQNNRKSDPFAFIGLLTAFKVGKAKIEFADSGFRDWLLGVFASQEHKSSEEIKKMMLSELERKIGGAKDSEKGFYQALHNFFSGKGRFTVSVDAQGKQLPIHEIMDLVFKGDNSVKFEITGA